ncbi:MAG: ribosome-recycling factor [Patescibacteria group bacterium]
MATLSDQYLKELDSALRVVIERFRDELRSIRGNRPSADLVQDLKVNIYDQVLTIQQLGSLSVFPPRAIQISVWDKNSVGAVVKAIEDAKIGLSVSNDGNNVIATLSQLHDERRDELVKLVKKNGEGARIQVRARRDETMKKIKEAEAGKSMSEDEAFRAKEKAQKLVEETNKQIESLVEGKAKEMGE